MSKKLSNKYIESEKYVLDLSICVYCVVQGNSNKYKIRNWFLYIIYYRRFETMYVPSSEQLTKIWA